MGRRLDPVPGTGNIRCCSLFKSTYDYAGNPVSGAARNPIKTFPIETENGKLVISLNENGGF
jgi:Rieske Fe-S protein